MKRISILLLVLTLVLGLTACATDPAPAGTTAPTDPSDHVVPFDPTYPSETEATDATDPTVPPETTTMRLVADVTLMREPDAHSATSGILLAGNEVEVVGFEKDWVTILIGEELRYIPSGTVRELGKYLVVIDAGHQAKANTDKEPIGPNATEQKIKVASGTQGVSTGLPEYQLNLAVSLKLRDILEDRGYQVAMIRTTHDVDMSNAERAQIANSLYADAFIRVHANGSEDSSVHGIVTICQTDENPYNAELYQQCKELSTLVLDEMVAATGAKRLYVWETDTMSGINWCATPVTIVEMGFMSNPEEDQRMATEEYQEKLAIGIANGIDRFFS